MARYFLTVLIVTAVLTASGARAAEIDIPPPVKPRELPVQANQPNCARWTDECVNCTRGADGEGPTCSNIGFACQPKAIRCIAVAIPEGQSGKK